MNAQVPPSALVVVVASTGGIETFATIARSLPASLPCAIALVVHRPPEAPMKPLIEILQTQTALHVKVAE